MNPKPTYCIIKLQMSTMRTRSMAMATAAGTESPIHMRKRLEAAFAVAVARVQPDPTKLADIRTAFQLLLSQLTPPTPLLIAVEPFHKGFDNESDPKMIAGFPIPTTAAGWTERLDEIDAFVETCKERVMNNERITDVTNLQRYLNFLNVSMLSGVAARYGLFARDNIEVNAGRTYKLVTSLRRLNVLV